MKRIIHLWGRKTGHFLVWISVFFTMISLIFTLLTMYQFTYIKYFDSYRTFQGCMIVTMFIMGIRMLDLKENYKNWVYSILCILIAVTTAFFMFMNVY